MRAALAKLAGLAQVIKIDVGTQSAIIEVDPDKFREEDALAALKAINRGGSSVRR